MYDLDIYLVLADTTHFSYMHAVSTIPAQLAPVVFGYKLTVGVYSYISRTENIGSDSDPTSSVEARDTILEIGRPAGASRQVLRCPSLPLSLSVESTPSR